MATLLQLDLGSMEFPDKGKAAAQIAAACSSLFMTHGVVAWPEELEAVPVVVAAVMAGGSEGVAVDMMRSVVPFDAGARTHQAVVAVEKILAAGDSALLRDMVAAAEAGRQIDLADNAPGWAFALRHDPGLAIATGIAFDAVNAVGDARYVPMTAAASTLLQLCPLEQAEADLDFEPPAPAPVF